MIVNLGVLESDETLVALNTVGGEDVGFVLFMVDRGNDELILSVLI